MIDDKFIVHIDTECQECGLRNRMSVVLAEQIEIVACGRCGNFIMHPKDMTEDEMKIMKEAMRKTIRDLEK